MEENEIGCASVSGNDTPHVERPRRALKPDAQPFDEIRITTIPRYKQSGLSGDEWRISAKIEFYRKGRLIHEDSARDVESAAKFLAWKLAMAIDDGKAFYAGEENFCDQEGCAEQATYSLRLKSEFCREGHGTAPHGVVYRKFCDRHRHRGDSSFEDSDSNYVEIPNA